MHYISRSRKIYMTTSGVCWSSIYLYFLYVNCLCQCTI